jgi:signal transduction histidine kinase
MLRRSLARKLTLAFLLVALMVALLVAVFLRLNSANQLNQLVVEQQRSQFETTLVNYYTANGSWQGVWNYIQQTRHGPPPLATGQPTPGPGYGYTDGGPGPAGFGPDRHSMFGLVDSQGQVIIPLMPGYPVGAQVSATAMAQGATVQVNNQVVGTILTAPLPPGLTPEETAYLERTNSALLLASGGAVLVAVLVGVLLARTLTRPLQALTEATHRMAAGELEQAVAVNSTDEIGELARAFNRMSRELARANLARRQMTADIAHELRTPLSVVAGYIESMADGVLAPTPERLALIQAEIVHLQQLVSDLRTLTQADAGQLPLDKQTVFPRDVLQRARSAFEHQAARQGVTLDLNVDDATPAMAVDETRLAQVLDNLLSNALRYTPAGGRISLGAQANGSALTLSVQDTGQGIAPADLPFVFNRLYRADRSRSAGGGETGLGLAIVKALVEAHGGTIEVKSELGRGTTFLIQLPAQTVQLPAQGASGILGPLRTGRGEASAVHGRWNAG